MGWWRGVGWVGVGWDGLGWAGVGIEGGWDAGTRAAGGGTGLNSAMLRDGRGWGKSG